MNGAESLVKTLLAHGIDTCFTNPGTSELHFVAALDAHPAMRASLCLFEGVATGAADGYARMTDTPAATLLHLGPGLANGLANLHNARRAATPMVNVVGDHARHHRALDAPLTSDVEAVARPFSTWVRSAAAPTTVARDCAAAIHAARTPPGGIATLVLPADCAWGESTAAIPEPPPLAPHPSRVADEVVDEAHRWLRRGVPTLVLIGGRCLREPGLRAAQRLVALPGVTVLAPTSNARIERGGDLPAIERLPYPLLAARERLAGFAQVILVEAKTPVPFFAYPGQSSELLPADCRVLTLAEPGQDGTAALQALIEGNGAVPEPPPTAPDPGIPTGLLTPELLAQVLARGLPDGAIVVDEGLTAGRGCYPATAHGPRHTWLTLTGGAIGIGMPLATGAALACPERRVISLQADGSGLYTLQALWTQARERLPVTTVVLANRAYAILKHEIANLGLGQMSARGLALTQLDNPAPDWVSLAAGFGVEGARTDSAEGLADLLRASAGRSGPFLIEASL